MGPGVVAWMAGRVREVVAAAAWVRDDVGGGLTQVGVWPFDAGAFGWLALAG
jgi:hypothetical protein